MQGTDAHVPGGGDILARCAIALCRSRGVSFLGWMKENGRLEFGLTKKFQLPLEALQHLLFDAILPPKLIWIIFHFF